MRVICRVVKGPLVGQFIGSYRVVRALGEGGMGIVFEAVQEEIGRRVAIKLLREEVARTPQVANRFLNEARAANAVHHPGIVAVSEFGRTGAGIPYLVMEYLEGESLAARISRTGCLGEQAVRLGRQISSTMAVAHDKGIVHRDLKPDNVMIVRDAELPGGERTKILDFGIAKLAHEYSSPGTARTRTGMLLGTPAYMAPEQCREASTVTDKADVYALGVMLYQMLCGQLPFQAAEWFQVLDLHVNAPPPPLRHYVPAVPLDLEHFVLRMLAKRPADRPTMAQVTATLERIGAMKSTLPVGSSAAPTILAGLTTLHGATGQSSLRSVPKPGQRALAIAVGCVAIGLVAAGVARSLSVGERTAVQLTAIPTPAGPVRAGPAAAVAPTVAPAMAALEPGPPRPEAGPLTERQPPVAALPSGERLLTTGALSPRPVEAAEAPRSVKAPVVNAPSPVKAARRRPAIKVPAPSKSRRVLNADLKILD